MRYDNASATSQPQVAIDNLFGFGIKGTGGFIHYQNGRIVD